MTEHTRYAVVVDGKYLRHAKKFSYAGGKEYVLTEKVLHARLYTKRHDAQLAAHLCEGAVVEARIVLDV